MRIRVDYAVRTVLFVFTLGMSLQAHATTFAITGGTVHTLGALGTIAEGTVIVENGIIIAVGEDVTIPDGAEIIDATDKIVTPGIFDPYSYMGIEEISLVDESVDRFQQGDRFTAAFDVTDAINPRSTLIPVNRIEGVTRALVAPAVTGGSHIIAGQGAIIQLGSVDNYVVRRHAAMFVELGEEGADLAGGSRGLAIMALTEALDDAADFAANRDAYDERRRRDYALSRLDLEALQGVLNGEVPLVVTAHRISDIETALRLSQDRSLRLVINGGTEAWMIADKLARAGVPVLLEPTQNLPQSFENLGATLEAAARLNEAGATVAFAYGDSHNARNLTQSAGNAVAYGMPWHEALKAITVNPAVIFGIADSYGTLEPGKDADIVVWSGDPLEVTSFADHVLIRGIEIPMHSRQTLLRDRYRDLDFELPPAYRRR